MRPGWFPGRWGPPDDGSIETTAPDLWLMSPSRPTYNASQCIWRCTLCQHGACIAGACIALQRTSSRKSRPEQKRPHQPISAPYPPPYPPSTLISAPVSPPQVWNALPLHYSARFLNFSGIITRLFRRPFFDSSNSGSPLLWIWQAGCNQEASEDLITLWLSDSTYTITTDMWLCLLFIWVHS